MFGCSDTILFSIQLRNGNENAELSQNTVFPNLVRNRTNVGSRSRWTRGKEIIGRIGAENFRTYNGINEVIL